MTAAEFAAETNPWGAYVEHLAGKLGPLLDPEDLSLLASMARRAEEADALRQALAGVQAYLNTVADSHQQFLLYQARRGAS